MMPLGQLRQPLNLPTTSSKMTVSVLSIMVNWTLRASPFTDLPSVFGGYICRRNLMQNKALRAKIPFLKTLVYLCDVLLLFNIDTLIRRLLPQR